MQALIKRFVRGESGVTACGLIAAALMLIGVGAWVVATAPPCCRFAADRNQSITDDDQRRESAYFAL
jgi:hypothetical protein